MHRIILEIKCSESHSRERLNKQLVRLSSVELWLAQSWYTVNLSGCFTVVIPTLRLREGNWEKTPPSLHNDTQSSPGNGIYNRNCPERHLLCKVQVWNPRSGKINIIQLYITFPVSKFCAVNAVAIKSQKGEGKITMTVNFVCSFNKCLLNL